MVEIIKKSDTPHLFQNLKFAIRVLAGKDKYREYEPFTYNELDDEGSKDIACLITDEEITLLAAKELPKTFGI